MTEEKENPPSNQQKTKDTTPETPSSSSSAVKATEEATVQVPSLSHEETEEDHTPATPVPSTSMDVTGEPPRPKEDSLSPFNLVTFPKPLKHKSPKKFLVDVDLLVSKWDMKSEEIPCLVGENISSSNSDENYGSFDHLKSSSPSRQHLKNHKPWIKTISGTLHFKDKDFKATMESWLMDGSDDSPPNSNSDYTSHYLNPDDEFEEFQEQPNIFNSRNTGALEKVQDLLTGDDYAKEDSSPCTQPICIQQNYSTDKTNKENKEKIREPPIDSIEKSVIETVNLLLKRVELCHSSLFCSKGNQNESAIETVFKMSEDDEDDHLKSFTNCFNSRCVYDHSSTKEHGNITDIGKKPLDRRITYGFGLDDYDDNIPKWETPAESKVAMDSETKQESRGEVDFLISKIEDLSIDVPAQANSGNRENASNVSTDCPPEAKKSEIAEDASMQDDSLGSESGKVVFREYGETPDKSESKHKKRVTFADELEKNSQDEEESVTVKQNTGSGEVQETQQESMTTTFLLPNEVNPGREVTSAVTLVREVNPSGDDESNISSLSPVEHTRPENPRTEFVPSEANEDLVSKTQRKSPIMVDVQEKIVDEEKVIEKQPGKFSRLYKSMKKKIGKLL